MALLALKTLKILSRKEDNRRRFGRELCRAVVRLALAIGGVPRSPRRGRTWC